MRLTSPRSLRRSVPVARALLRLLLASVGGYALATAAAFALARALPMSRAEAAVAAALAAVLVMPAAAVWAYAVPLRHAAAGILGATAICAALALLIGQPG